MISDTGFMNTLEPICKLGDSGKSSTKLDTMPSMKSFLSWVAKTLQNTRNWPKFVNSTARAISLRNRGLLLMETVTRISKGRQSRFERYASKCFLARYS